MSDWIEINLPWRLPFNYEEKQFPFPLKPSDYRKQFGTTQEEEWNKIGEGQKQKWNKAYQELMDDISNNATDKLRTSPKDRGWSMEDIDAEMAERYPHDPKNKLSVAVHQMLQFRSLARKIRAWQETHPAIIKHRELLKKDQEERDQKSFSGRKLNQPGTLIEVEHDGEVHTYLIGHINELRGVCDDCTAFDNATVKRYKVIWEEPKPTAG